MAPTAAVNASAMAPAHALLGIASAANAAASGEPASTSKRPRKERCPNWNVMEVKSLIEAKRDMLHEDMENNEKDVRRSMASDRKRWQRISNHVMKAGFSSCLRDGPACKSKWNQLLPEFKRLADFIQKADPDEGPYWTMQAVDRKRLGLPKSFPQEIYNVMQQWFGTSASMSPPHLWDLTTGGDLDLTSLSNRRKTSEEVSQRHGVEASEYADAAEEGSDEGTASTRAQSAPAAGEPSLPAHDPRSRGKQPVAEVNAAADLVNGICVVNLSSSGGVADYNLQRPPNTGVKRKSISGHSLIANATVAAGEAMSQTPSRCGTLNPSRWSCRSRFSVNKCSTSVTGMRGSRGTLNEFNTTQDCQLKSKASLLPASLICVAFWPGGPLLAPLVQVTTEWQLHVVMKRQGMQTLRKCAAVRPPISSQARRTST